VPPRTEPPGGGADEPGFRWGHDPPEALEAGSPATSVTPTLDWQPVTLTYPVLSPGSTLDLNLYQTGRPAGSDLLVDDVSLRSN
jgi:hypothetical protein